MHVTVIKISGVVQTIKPQRCVITRRERRSTASRAPHMSVGSKNCNDEAHDRVPKQCNPLCNGLHFIFLEWCIGCFSKTYCFSVIRGQTTPLSTKGGAVNFGVLFVATSTEAFYTFRFPPYSLLCFQIPAHVWMTRITQSFFGFHP